MQYPSDAFRMSWHSGNEITGQPLQWNILSRHCSTDKSSSIGSMESLDQPGQNYFEGTILPLDTGMYQNSRDSAYSSFSTSSKISDYTTSSRIDGSTPINCFLGSNKKEDDRYLQTKHSVVESQVDNCRQSPPQPPIRRDSLRETKTEFFDSDRISSSPCDLFHIPGMWSSETTHFNSSKNACQCTNVLCTGHLMENLSSDQYYMLSSQTNKVQQLNTTAVDDLEKSEAKIQLSKENKENKVLNYSNLKGFTEVVKNSVCEHWKALNHYCSPTNMPSVQVGFRKDVESISLEDYPLTADKCREDIEERYKCSANKDFEISQHRSKEQSSDTGDVHVCSSLDRSVTISKDPPSSQLNNYDDKLTSTCIINTITQDSCGQDENIGLAKKSGSSRHRSAEMRRKSDRFATNLRNEIQMRKAQLQKSKDCKVLLSCESSVEDKNDTLVSPLEIIPPPPPPLPPKIKTLLLEIKGTNAEKCKSSKDYLNQEKMEGELIDKNIETHKHNIKENILLASEAFTENKGFSPTVENKTFNKCWKSKASDTHLQKYFNKNQIKHPRNNEQKCSYTTTEFQHATMYTLPKPEMCTIEDEVSIGSLKTPVEQKPSTDIHGTDALKNRSDNQHQTETLDKQAHEDNTCYMNKHSIDSDREWDLMQCINEQPLKGRKINYQVNLEHENSNNLSSAAQLSGLQQFSEIKQFALCNRQNDAKWSWSPEQSLQTNFFTDREVGLERLTTTKMHDENILMPFADRRKFFEDVCRGPTFTVNDKSNVEKPNFYPSIPDYPLPQIIVPDLRRHSVDHTQCTNLHREQDSRLPHCDICRSHTTERPMCCNEEKQTENYLPSLSYGFRACIFCSNDFCPALLKRNIFLAHHSCHCQHLQQHYHHRWVKCGDCSFPTACNSLEESDFPHVDHMNMRKHPFQDIPLKECNQPHLKINKSSQSVSNLCNFLPGMQHSGSTKQCCNENSHEWSECYKATSSYDLSCENLSRPKDFSIFKGGHLEPSQNRAYSVSQLDLEYLELQNKIEFSTTKLEKRNPSTRPKKQKPPRPPPPKWEKYKEHQATKQLSESEFCCFKERSKSEYSIVPRKHFQSLPADRTFSEIACNLSSSPMHGLNHVKEQSEISCASKRCQESSPPASPALVTSKFKETYGWNNIDELFCSESIALEPAYARVHDGQCSSPEDIFKDEFRHSEDDWSIDVESEISIPERCEKFQPISVSPTTGATYYNISAAKADLLNRMKDRSGDEGKNENITEEEDKQNELNSKKLQLIESISRKLSVLNEAQQGLQEDINANAILGHELKNLLKSICKPNEYDKFRIFIGDLEKVVSLLLSLSGRLSRVESALNCEDPVPSMEAKMTLLDKKKQLTDQLEDAKELKVHVTRREQVVLETVSKYLNDEQLQDYHYYVKMISAFIVEQRELEDKICLGEEQLRCLRESL